MSRINDNLNRPTARTSRRGSTDGDATTRRRARRRPESGRRARAGGPDGAAASDGRAGAPPGDAPPSKPSWKTWVAVGVDGRGRRCRRGLRDQRGDVVGLIGRGGLDPDRRQRHRSPEWPGQYCQGGNGRAAPASPGDSGGFGTISTIDGSTLTIKDQSGTTTKVVTTDSTDGHEVRTGSVDDIKVGDTVMVVGTGSSSEIAATRVSPTTARCPPMTGRRPGRPTAAVRRTGRTAGRRRDNGPSGRTPTGHGPPNGPGAGRHGANVQVTRGVVKSVGDGTFTVTGTERHRGDRHDVVGHHGQRRPRPRRSRT